MVLGTIADALDPEARLHRDSLAFVRALPTAADNTVDMEPWAAWLAVRLGMPRAEVVAIVEDAVAQLEAAGWDWATFKSACTGGAGAGQDDGDIEYRRNDGERRG